MASETAEGKADRPSSRSGRSRRSWRWLLLLLLPLVVLPLVLFGLALIGSRSLEASARESWTKLLPEELAVARRFPARDANAAALKLEGLAAAIGIPLAPPGSGRAAVADRDRSAQLDLFAHAAERFAGGDGQLEELTPEDKDWIFRHEEPVQELITLLAEASPDERPRWEIGLALVAARGGPGPELTDAHRRLQGVLLARALEGVRLDDELSVRRALLAAWRLNEALGVRPGLAAARAFTEIHVVHARALRVLGAEAWLAGYPLEEAALERWLAAAASECWQLMALAAIDDLVGAAGTSVGPGWKRDLSNALVRPYVRASAADTSEVLARAAPVVLSQGCATDHAALARASASDVASWNRAGGAAVSRILRDWGAWVELAAEVELTRRVLALRSWQEGGRRGDPPPFSGGSCEELEWTEEIAPEGFRVRVQGRAGGPRAGWSAEFREGEW